MVKNKHLVFVIPSLQKGGMERVMTELSNFSVNQSVSVSIVCLITDRAAYILDNRVSVIKPPFEYKKGFINKLKVFRYLIKTLKKLNPDVVVSFSEVFNPLSIVISKLLNQKIIISDRSSPVLKHTLRDRLTRKATYWLATGMIAQTETAKNIFIKKGYNKNLLVLPNPLKEIKNDSINFRKKAIVNVGRLVDSKNQAELINLFLELNLENWHLFIVGGGPNYKKLSELIINSNAKDKITLTGEIDDVDYWLAKGSIFAYVSLSEGFPNALNEAMAFPLACIAYNCEAGVSDIIQDQKNGFLIEMGNSNDYKNKLIKLIEDENLREHFMNSSITGRNKYNINTIGLSFLNFIFK